MTQRTAGGAATIGGMTFQVEVAAWFAVQILAESEATPPFALPTDTTLRDILLETDQPTGDLKVSTSQGGRIFAQAKTSIHLSNAQDSSLASVISQFVRQCQAGYTAPGSPQRSLNSTSDRLVLAIGHAAPDTIQDNLRNVLDKVRLTSTPGMLAEVLATMGSDEKNAYEIIVEHVRRAWQATDEPPSKSDVFSLLKLVHVFCLDFRRDGHARIHAIDLLRRTVLFEPWQIPSLCSRFQREIEHEGGKAGRFSRNFTSRLPAFM